MDHVKKIDIFYVQPQFNVNGKNKFTSTLGSFMTIVFISLTIIIIIVESSNMIKKQNPYTRSQEEIQLNTPVYNFSDNKIIPMISFISNLGEDSAKRRGVDSTFFQIEFIELNADFTKNEESGNVLLNESIKNLPQKHCDENYLRELITDKDYAEKYFKRESISDFLCVDEKNLKDPLSMFGSWEDESMGLLGIRIKICNNASSTQSNKKCQPLEVINQHLMNGIFQINILHSLPNLNDYAQPVKQYFSQIALKGVLNQGKGLEVFLKKGKVETEDGEFGENNTVEEFFSLSTSSESILSSLNQNSDLVFIYLRLEKKIVHHYRRYEKFREVFSKVGGTVNLILFLMQIFVRYFSKLDYQVELVNNIFRNEKHIKPSKPEASSPDPAKRNENPAKINENKFTLNFLQKLKWIVSKLGVIKYDKGVYFDREYQKIEKYIDIKVLFEFMISKESQGSCPYYKITNLAENKEQASANTPPDNNLAQSSSSINICKTKEINGFELNNFEIAEEHSTNKNNL